MTNRIQDIILSTTLVFVSGCWTWLVIETIPPGFGEGEVGPRAFPLAFGILLLSLSAIQLFRAFFRQDERLMLDTGAAEIEIPEINHFKWTPALLVLGEIALYGFLLEKIGFVLATPVVVFLVMIISLRERSLPKLIGMPLGVTVGSWLIFEKLLGIYLANGIWLNVG